MSVGLTGIAHADNGSLGKENFTLVVNTGSADKVLGVSHLSIDGTVAYCVDLKHGNDRGDAYMVKDGANLNDAKLAVVEAILSHGFDGKNADAVLAAAGVTKADGFTSDDATVAAYAGTQAAIWHALFPDEFALASGAPTDAQIAAVTGFTGHSTWFNGVDGLGREFATSWWLPQTAAIQKIYKYLLDGNFTAPSLTITPATATATVGAKAGPFTVKITGASDAALTGSEGTVLVDKDGKAVTKAANNAQVFVDCKAEGTFTVTAKSKFWVAKAKFWVGAGERQRQKVVTPVKVEKELTATATATCTPAPVVPGLPVTGAPVIGTVAAGLVLLVAGAGLFLVRRRRRIRFTA